MSSHTKWRRRQSLTKEEKERSERLRQIREEWRVQQEFYREHEEKKKKYKKEYERNRAEAMKKEKSPDERRSKNSSPQRREISSSEQSTSKERRTSVIGNGPEGVIIDKKELQLTKIRIYTECIPTKNQSTSDKIEQDIINPDDIIVPRRQNEGACPIFQKSKVKKTEEIRTITVSQNEQLEKQLSTSMKNVHIGRRPDDNTAQHYRSDMKTIRRDDRTDNDRYNRERRRSSSIRDSKEKDRSRSERRDRSTSRYGSRSAPLSRNRSRSRYRSRSHSPISERAKERRVDNDKNKFSSRRNYPDYPLFYQPYVCLPRPMLMPRLPKPMPMPRPMLMPRFPKPMPMPRPPMFVPVIPPFSELYPAMNVPEWRRPPPPRFFNGVVLNRASLTAQKSQR